MEKKNQIAANTIMADFVFSLLTFSGLLILQYCNYCNKYCNTFYPLDAVLERVIAVASCPSVCLSVTAGIVSKRKQLAS